MRRWEVVAIFLAATSPCLLFRPYRIPIYVAGVLAASIACEVLEARRRRRAEAEIDVVEVFR